MARHPDEILEDFDRGSRRASFSPVDMRSVLWEIIEDIQDSYKLAILDLCYGTHKDGGKFLEKAVRAEVNDYLENHYGED